MIHLVVIILLCICMILIGAAVAAGNLGKPVGYVLVGLWRARIAPGGVAAGGNDQVNWSLCYILVCMVAFSASCSPKLPPCDPSRVNMIVADCKLDQVKRGCEDAPEKECPDIVKACDARIDALSDEEVCNP